MSEGELLQIENQKRVREVIQFVKEYSGKMNFPIANTKNHSPRW